ncbi:hypothetical protein ACSV5S_21175 [Agrobacterium deltaense]|uniref:hypothetical protein n=1 Tax=Agrobacterium deltaense TaxID=1183412 RepID=UPI003FD3DF76
MPGFFVLLRSPAVQAGLIIPGAVMLILLAATVLPFWSGAIAGLINALALACGILGGVCHILDIMPPALALEEIEWRREHPDDYGDEEWEAVPLLQNILVRIRVIEPRY